MLPQESVRHEKISIHALREEGDRCRSGKVQLLFEFLSTPSARRATHRRTQHHEQIAISIHALREEGDKSKVVRRP